LQLSLPCPRAAPLTCSSSCHPVINTHAYQSPESNPHFPPVGDNNSDLLASPPLKSRHPLRPNSPYNRLREASCLPPQREALPGLSPSGRSSGCRPLELGHMSSSAESAAHPRLTPITPVSDVPVLFQQGGQADNRSRAHLMAQTTPMSDVPFMFQQGGQAATPSWGEAAAGGNDADRRSLTSGLTHPVGGVPYGLPWAVTQ